MAADILVVDDEADIRDLVAGILEDEGYAVRTAGDSDTALAAIRARRPSLLIQDIWMQGGGLDGLELLDVVKSVDADLPGLGDQAGDRGAREPDGGRDRVLVHALEVVQRRDRGEQLPARQVLLAAHRAPSAASADARCISGRIAS